MSSNFQYNKTDLDNIFKPRYSPTTASSTNFTVGLSLTDLNFYYEPSKSVTDRASVTNYNFIGYGDICNLFQAKNYCILSGDIKTTSESWKKYSRSGDGTVIATINTNYAKSVGGVFKLRLSVYSSSNVFIRSTTTVVSDTAINVTMTVGGLFGNSDNTTIPYNGPNTYQVANSDRIDNIIIQDLNSNWTSAAIPVIINYNSGSLTYPSAF